MVCEPLLLVGWRHRQRMILEMYLAVRRRFVAVSCCVVLDDPTLCSSSRFSVPIVGSKDRVTTQPINHTLLKHVVFQDQNLISHVF